MLSLAAPKCSAECAYICNVVNRNFPSNTFSFFTHVLSAHLSPIVVCKMHPVFKCNAALIAAGGCLSLCYFMTPIMNLFIAHGVQIWAAGGAKGAVQRARPAQSRCEAADVRDARARRIPAGTAPAHACRDLLCAASGVMSLDALGVQTAAAVSQRPWRDLRSADSVPRRDLRSADAFLGGT